MIETFDWRAYYAYAIIGLIVVTPFIMIFSWWLYRLFKSMMGSLKINELKDAYWIWKFKKELQVRNVPIEEIQEEMEEFKWSLFKKRSKQPAHLLDKINNEITGEFDEKMKEEKKGKK